MKITDALDQLLRVLTSEGGERDAAATAESAPRAAPAARPASWGERDDASRAAGAANAGSVSPARAGLATSGDNIAVPPPGTDGPVPAALDNRFTTAHIESTAVNERALPEWVRRSRESSLAGAGAVELAPSETPPGELSGEVAAQPDPTGESGAPVDEVESIGVAATDVANAGTVEAPPVGAVAWVPPAHEAVSFAASEQAAAAQDAEPVPSRYEPVVEQPAEPPVVASFTWAPPDPEPEPPAEAVSNSAEPVPVDLAWATPSEQAAVAEAPAEAPAEPPAEAPEPPAEAPAESPAVLESFAWAPPETQPELPVEAVPSFEELSVAEDRAWASSEPAPVAEAPAEPTPVVEGMAWGGLPEPETELEPVAVEELLAAEEVAWVVSSEHESSQDASIEEERPADQLGAGFPEDEPLAPAPWAIVLEDAAPAETERDGSDAEDETDVSSAQATVGGVLDTRRPGELDVALAPAPADFARLEATASVVESLNLGFHLGSAVERIAAAAGQGSEGIPALRQAAWLIERYVALLERRPIGADLHLSAVRLARTGDTITDLKALAAALDGAYAGSGASFEPSPDAAAADAGASSGTGSAELA